MIWVDYAIAVIMVVSALVGLMRGFVKELSRLLTWLLTVAVCAQFAPDFAVFFQNLSADPLAQLALASGSLLVSVLLLSALIQWLLKDVLLKDRLTLWDRMLGILFGLFRGGFIMSLVLLIVSASPLAQSTWWTRSAFIPFFQPVSHLLKEHLPARWAGYIHH